MEKAELGKVKPYNEVRYDATVLLDSQIANLYEMAYNLGEFNPYPEPVYKKGERDDEEQERMKEVEDRQQIEIYNPGNPIVHPDGFKLHIRKSRIDHPESGYGVFVEGTILKGTVIGFYPGVVHYAQNLRKEVVEGNDYMIGRYDHSLIDGRQWDRLSERYTRQSKHLMDATGLQSSGANLKPFRNPFAIANYINHPPAGEKPNVFCLDYTYPKTFPEEYIPYIPHFYDKPPSISQNQPSALMIGSVCIARENMSDCELYLNYRYNPINPYPDWYTQPDEEEAKRRWGTESVLPIHLSVAEFFARTKN